MNPGPRAARVLASPVLVLLLGALTLAPGGGCATGGGEGSGGEGASERAAAKAKERSPEEASAALKRAEAAFLAGKFGRAVVQANKVMEGAASPEEYYAAVKIVGLASCNRRDPRPVGFAYTRLQPSDQESLRRECELNGLTISADGQVTVGEKTP